MYQLSQYLPLISNSQQVISRNTVKNSDFCKGIDRRLSVAALILRNTSGRYAHQFCHNRSGNRPASRNSSNAVPLPLLLQSDVQIVYKITLSFSNLFLSISFELLFFALPGNSCRCGFPVARKMFHRSERNTAA